MSEGLAFDDGLGVGTIPELPEARGYESSATIDLRPRYDDIAQDGRVQLISLVSGLGAVWRALPRRVRGARFGDGVLPILHRMVIRNEPGPFSVDVALEATGTWRLARETGGHRLFLDMWLEVRAPVGATFAPTPPPDAPRALVGRIYASHVFTRPFAPAGERKVTRLDVPDVPAIPEDTHAYADAAALTSAAVAAAGRPLEAAGDHVFGLAATDANQHVNSLVYSRLFEAAAVGRLAADGDPRATSTLASVFEIRFRKPFFAGDRATIALVLMPPAAPASTASPGVVAAGAFSPGAGVKGADAPKPNTTLALRLS